MTPDGELLRRYTETNSESAFAELVERHLALVYSAALRQVNGDAHLAQDVAQTVFADLARKAGSLARRPVLTGWLYTSAHFAAAKAVRTERRRHTREEEAQLMNQLLCDPAPDLDWEKLRPVLDAVMLELNETECEAVLLRYFDNRPHAEIADRLGLSENAARMRVDRALVKLRTLLAHRGMSTTAALSAVISANAVQVAPAGLAVTVSTAAALAGTTLATTATATATKAITMSTLQKTLIAATLVAAVGTGVYEARQVSRLRSENQNLTAQQETLTDERDKALAAATGKDSELQRLQKDKNELLRLRGEVGLLRRQKQELERLREENRQLQASLAKSSQPAQQPETDPEDTPERRAAYAKINDAKMLVLGLIMHASDNQDRLPTDLSQTTNYLANGEPRLTGTNQFELVVQGSLKNVTNPATTIAVREKEAWIFNGHRQKTYGFADGHAELKREPPEGFDAWEKQHIIPPPTNP